MMKKILIMSIFFSSCTTTPMIDGEKPFVVTSIQELNGTNMSEYSGTAAYFRNGASYSPAIVLPSRLYNIGDTVTIIHKKHQK